MPFYARVNDSLGRANSAARQLRSYNHYNHPRERYNAQVRNNARLTIDPAYYNLQQALREARWEGVRASDAREASYASRLIQQATWSLSDRPEEGRPANVRAAQDQIWRAVEYLNRARW